jgi:hypothetical protein
MSCAVQTRPYRGHLPASFSPSIMDEYQEVLPRPRFKLRPGDIAKALTKIDAVALRVTPTIELDETTDADANRFLECAEAGQADYLITVISRRAGRRRASSTPVSSFNTWSPPTESGRCLRTAILARDRGVFVSTGSPRRPRGSSTPRFRAVDRTWTILESIEMSLENVTSGLDDRSGVRIRLISGYSARLG